MLILVFKIIGQRFFLSHTAFVINSWRIHLQPLSHPIIYAAFHQLEFKQHSDWHSSSIWATFWLVFWLVFKHHSSSMYTADRQTNQARSMQLIVRLTDCIACSWLIILKKESIIVEDWCKLICEIILLETSYWEIKIIRQRFSHTFCLRWKQSSIQICIRNSQMTDATDM